MTFGRRAPHLHRPCVVKGQYDGCMQTTTFTPTFSPSMRYCKPSFITHGTPQSGLPEIRTSTCTIMRTLCLVRNALHWLTCTVYVHIHIQSEPLKCGHLVHSVKRTLHLAPTVSPPIQTHPYSGHFANKFVGSLVKQTTRGATCKGVWYFPISVMFVMCEIHISRVHHVRNPYRSCYVNHMMATPLALPGTCMHAVV